MGKRYLFAGLLLCGMFVSTSGCSHMRGHHHAKHHCSKCCEKHHCDKKCCRKSGECGKADISKCPYHKKMMEQKAAEQ